MASLPFHCLHLPGQVPLCSHHLPSAGLFPAICSSSSVAPALPAMCSSLQPGHRSAVLPTLTFAGPLLPATAASCPCGAEPQQSFQLSGSRRHLEPQLDALPHSSQHPEHNLLILFLQFLCASVVSAKGFYIFNNVSPKCRGASF